MGFSLRLGCCLGVGILLRSLGVVHLFDGGVELALLVGVGLRVGHVLLVEDGVRLVDRLPEAIAGGVVSHLPVGVLERLVRAVNTLPELRLGGFQLLGELAVHDFLQGVVQRLGLGVGFVSVLGVGVLRLNELPCHPLIRLGVGNTSETLRLLDGVVELVQQLGLLELVRLVGDGGRLVYRLRELGVGGFGSNDRVVVCRSLEMRPIRIATYTGDENEDDGCDGNRFTAASVCCGFGLFRVLHVVDGVRILDVFILGGWCVSLDRGGFRAL